MHPKCIIPVFLVDDSSHYDIIKEGLTFEWVALEVAYFDDLCVSRASVSLLRGRFHPIETVNGIESCTCS